MNTRNLAIVYPSVAAIALIFAAACHAQQFNPPQNSGNEVQSTSGLLQPIAPANQNAAQNEVAPTQPPFARQNRSGISQPLAPANPVSRQTQQGDQPHTIQPKSPETFQLKGRFHLVSGTRSGFLILRAEIPEGSYIYSMTNAEGPGPSQITVAPGNAFRIGQSFESDRHPVVTEHDELLDCRLEKHYRLVQFFVPIEIAEGVDPTTIRPEITFNGQVCSDEGFCVALDDKKVAADFAGYFEQQAQSETDSTESHR